MPARGRQGLSAAVALSALLLCMVHLADSSSCISLDYANNYVCTDDPEASRRAVSLVADDGSDMSSAFDLDLGVEQRITGSAQEQIKIRAVLRKMYKYFDEEVLSRPEYERVRGKCKNQHELCAFWSSVGECESNRGFMLEHCAAGCRLCILAHTNLSGG